MPTVARVAAYLEQLAPPRLAEEWDNVGLLVGRREAPVRRLMTCLTVTPQSAAEAVAEGADLVVAHHPMPFRALRQLTDASVVGRLLLDLIAANVAVYSAHTAFDSAAEGVNQRLAEGLGLREIVPLVPNAEGLGTGRWGRAAEPISLAELSDRVKTFLKIDRLQTVGDPAKRITAVAAACGAAETLLDAACAAGCDAVVLGEARFHACLEAEARGVALVMPGHFASERFAVVCLAEALGRQFPDVRAWASRRERDPVRWE